ncbi:MAG: HipA domain-containing protein [Balneolaceae bacterium]
MKGIRKEKILKYSGILRNLDGLVPYLREGFVYVEKNLPLTGDAPKLFIREYEYGAAPKRTPKNWPAYIAKVGHKWYPVESIMEQLLTDLGKLYGLDIADSKLVIASGQLRFLSKYFLKKDERLMHGAEIYASNLNEDIGFVEEIEDKKMSPEFFTVSFTQDAFKNSFPEHYNDLFCDLLEMLAFDAITGNNDRHFYNWGVITDIQNIKQPTFAPIYDTARALFWNFSDDKINNVTRDNNLISTQIEKYGRNSKPKMGIENRNNLNHFKFIKEIYKHFPHQANCITKVIKNSLDVNEAKLIDDEYRYLLSKDRRKLIKNCLHFRKAKLLKIAKKYDQAI